MSTPSKFLFYNQLSEKSLIAPMMKIIQSYVRTATVVDYDDGTFIFIYIKTLTLVHKHTCHTIYYIRPIPDFLVFI